MKKTLLASFLFIAVSNTFAGVNAKDGLYLGADLASSGFHTIEGAALRSNFDLPFYVRPFLGYRINDYIAVETGYNELKDYSSSGGDYFGPDHYKLNYIDIAGKLIYPFENGWSIYGKLGGAYVQQDVYNQPFVGSPPSVDTNSSQLLPLAGVGVSFNFTQRLAMELFVQYVPGNNTINSITTAGFGLSFTI